jgi:hypothetical protein
MGLEARLNQFESILSSRKTMFDHAIGTDDVIKHLGLDPAAGRKSDRRTGSSLTVASSLVLGIEPREFARLIKEKANLVRW